jgi:hypothetical protein
LDRIKEKDMINNINNLESASSIREKLNELITIVNHYSSSQFTGGYTPPTGTDGTSGGYTPPPTGPSLNSVTIYDSTGIGGVVGHDTKISACSAYPGAPKTIWYSKGGGNIGAGIEVNDSVFSDSTGTTPLNSMKWYGYQEYAMNKAFYVTAGMVSTVEMC